MSAGLIAIVIRQVDLSYVKSLAVRPQDLPWLVAAIGLFNLSKIAGALRLNGYQRHAAILMSERENLKLYYAGMFLNLFLPGGIGGDGYKILVLRHQQGVPIKTLLWIFLTDRFSGLLILLLLLCMLAPLLALPWPQAAVQTIAAVGATTIAAMFVLAHHRLVKMHGERLAMVFGYGLAVQLLQLVCMGMLLAYLRVPIDAYLAYLAVFLISSIAAVLPLSFGGLGAREVTFLYGLQLLQLDPMPGVVASAGFFLITVVSSLVGVLFLKGFPIKPPPAA
ncbi:MAG: hypothetical protein JWQ23_4090 [Herminiimonas sp.]|nr:hypothetical protein [Herminiimonas sp.]